MSLCVIKYMCRIFCCGLEMLRFLLIFEFVYFYTINPVTAHLRNCILTLMTQSRPWNQLLHSCALLSNIFIPDVSNYLEAPKKMAEKLTFWLIFCTLMTFSISDVHIPNASRKYISFPFTSNSLPQSCVWKWRVLSNVHLSQKCLLILCLGKLDWGICNISFKVLM